jgi:hypothetical protein
VHVKPINFQTETLPPRMTPRRRVVDCDADRTCLVAREHPKSAALRSHSSSSRAARSRSRRRRLNSFTSMGGDAGASADGVVSSNRCAFVAASGTSAAPSRSPRTGASIVLRKPPSRAQPRCSHADPGPPSLAVRRLSLPLAAEHTCYGKQSVGPSQSRWRRQVPQCRNLRCRHLMYWEGGRRQILPDAAPVRFRTVGLGRKTPRRKGLRRGACNALRHRGNERAS